MPVAKAETRRADTRRERVEEKERAILSAARAVFVKHGFERARMAEIAKRAGVAEGQPVPGKLELKLENGETLTRNLGCSIAQ